MRCGTLLGVGWRLEPWKQLVAGAVLVANDASNVNGLTTLGLTRTKRQICLRNESTSGLGEIVTRIGTISANTTMSGVSKFITSFSSLGTMHRVTMRMDRGLSGLSILVGGTKVCAATSTVAGSKLSMQFIIGCLTPCRLAGTLLPLLGGSGGTHVIGLDSTTRTPVSCGTFTKGRRLGSGRTCTRDGLTLAV